MENTTNFYLFYWKMPFVFVLSFYNLHDILIIIYQVPTVRLSAFLTWCLIDAPPIGFYFGSWNPTRSTENWYSSITRSSVFLSVFTRNVLGKIFFSRNVPISMREGGGEIKLKISLFKMSLFMVGGEGPIEKGPMSWILLFIFLEVVP